jgi:hypothetical protein
LGEIDAFDVHAGLKARDQDSARTASHFQYGPACFTSKFKIEAAVEFEVAEQSVIEFGIVEGGSHTAIPEDFGRQVFHPASSLEP